VIRPWAARIVRASSAAGLRPHWDPTQVEDVTEIDFGFGARAHSFEQLICPQQARVGTQADMQPEHFVNVRGSR
jgi:hypothetical protein